MGFTPSTQQEDAIKAIKKWYRESSSQVFYLAGYAGTGKTTLTQHVIDDLGLDASSMDNVMFGSYTGKAAFVMRQNGMETASTVHRMIYKPVEDKETGKISFILNYYDSPVNQTNLVVLDECSMIDTKMKNDLLSFNKKILVLGDPGQLDPINGPPAFSNPDVFLTEIHRQAKDNPIILTSMLARNGENIPMGDFGDVKVIHASKIDLNELTKAEQVITGKNATRNLLNNEIRFALGYKDDCPLTSGAKLVCLKNNYDKGILNGMLMWTASNDCYMSKTGRFFTQSLVDDDCGLYELDISCGPFTEYKKPRTEKEKLAEMKDRNIQLFDYGWVLTVHKSQGSQWDEVYIYDDGFGLWDNNLRSKWLYTGITRAAKKLTIIK